MEQTWNKQLFKRVLLKCKKIMFTYSKIVCDYDEIYTLCVGDNILTTHEMGVVYQYLLQFNRSPKRIYIPQSPEACEFDQRRSIYNPCGIRMIYVCYTNISKLLIDLNIILKCAFSHTNPNAYTQL